MPSWLLRGAIKVVLVLFVAGCSPTTSPNTSAIAQAQPEGIAISGADCIQDRFSQGLNQAFSAAVLAQVAKSPQEWDSVAIAWINAIAQMQAVPLSNPQRAAAEKKITEYLHSLSVARRKAASSSKSFFTTFNNPIFDQQLLLYQSYVAAVGPPDVLIVGSSRALQGVDAKALQRALANKGYGNLKIFNLSVNGATVQVVDLLLRRILSDEHLPRLIVWADGVRAFNSGRADRTFAGLVNSPGYKQLLNGIRPKLPLERNPAGACNLSKSQVGDIAQGQIVPAATIDAFGFLPVAIRFNPATYYQRHPRVAGRYDGDYQAFNLGGKQAAALNNLFKFTKANQIEVVFVNLPLTQDYLNRGRRRYEQQFRRFMQQQSREKRFIFVDLGLSLLNRNDHFADPSHLNRYGAEKVSNQIAADQRIRWR